MTIRPLHDYLLLKQEEATTQTAAGLYLPEQSAEKPKIGVVVAIAEDIKDKYIEGDRLIYKPYAVTEVKIKDETFLLIKEEDVLGLVEEDNG